MKKTEQDKVIDFLKARRAKGTTEHVEMIETHAALVFLSGTEALKIKRAVAYDYLDYSTLAKRRDALRRELELNAPAAPTIYRDVIAVTRSAEGALQLDGNGEVVEWVLRMHRFSRDDELAHVAERGDLDAALADALGASIARYHARTEPRTGKSSVVLIAQILDELGREFSDMGDVLPEAGIAAFRAASAKRLDRLHTLLITRTQQGHVRRCHGDLHLRNIVLVDGAPVPFDALEFDEELGTCDVLYDLAFLLMDLRHKGLGAASNRVLNEYLRVADSSDHLRGLAALPLFLAVRAAISAMVAVQTLRAHGDNAPELTREARDYLQDALAALAPPPPMLVAVGGISGTGKTTLARGLAADCGPTPGAIHLRSDLTRKALFGVEPLEKLPESAYAPEVGLTVYARLAEQAAQVLSAGHAVLVDAVFLTADTRDGIEAVARAAGADFHGLWMDAPANQLRRRVTHRTGDASDANAQVVDHQLEQVQPPAGWTRIDASGSADSVLQKARRALAHPGIEPNEPMRSTTG